MREPAAIIAPAIDVAQAAKRVRAALYALNDAKGKADRLESEIGKAREEERRRALDLGRELIKTRPAWPKRGPKAKGWGEFLRDQGIDDRRAREWMEYAGYVEDEVSASNENNAENLPSVNERYRPRKSEPRDADEVASDDGPQYEEVTEEERESSYRREVEAALPERMQAREAKTHSLVDLLAQARSSLRDGITARNVHLTDVTTSPEDFMRAKQLMIDIVNLFLEELDAAGVLDGKERRRQLQLLDGGKR